MPRRGQQGFPRVALSAACALALLGCEGAPARSKPWRHAAEPATGAQDPATTRILEREGDRVQARRERANTLRIHLPEQVSHLHPMISPTTWGRRIVHQTVFETLLRATPDGYEPGLASSFAVSPDGKEIRIDLRDGVTFHDGKKLTSVDVQFSLDSARSPRVDADHLRSELSDVTAVELISARSVRIRLAKQNGYVLRALAEVPILSQSVYQSRLKTTRGPAIGTGPYQVASATDDQIRLERNDDYWGEQPAIPNIVYVYDPDDARALTAAKSGDLDILPAMSPIHYPEQAEAPGVAARLSPLRLRPPAMRLIALNSARRPFSDRRVRRAVSLLIDRKRLVERAHSGLAWSPPAWVWPGGPVHSAAVSAPRYDPAAAAELLDASGWRDLDGDGTRQRGGSRLMITVLATPEDNPERDAVLRAVREAGFVLDVRTGPSAVLENRLSSRQFDLAFIDWSGAADMDLTSYLASGGRHNWGGFSSPVIDSLLAELRVAAGPRERAAIASKLARALDTEMPVVPLTAPDPYGLVHRRVKGAVPLDGWIQVHRLQLLPEAAAE